MELTIIRCFSLCGGAGVQSELGFSHSHMSLIIFIIIQGHSTSIETNLKANNTGEVLKFNTGPYFGQTIGEAEKKKKKKKIKKIKPRLSLLTMYAISRSSR